MFSYLGRLGRLRGYSRSVTLERSLTLSPIQTSGGTAKIDLIAIEPRAGGVRGEDWIEEDPRVAAVDTAVILAGKMIGRGGQARDRDLYDLAVALKREPEQARQAFASLNERELQAHQSTLEGRSPLDEKALKNPTDADAIKNGREMVIAAYAEAAADRGEVRRRGMEAGGEGGVGQ